MPDIKPFEIKRNDLQPVYRFQAVDSDGEAIDITAATIRCSMRLEGATALKLDRVTAGVTITDGETGEGQYQWQAEDTDTAGDYDIEFEITPGSGGKFTLPSRDSEKARVKINPDIDGV